jgi:hypothetical protein
MCCYYFIFVLGLVVWYTTRVDCKDLAGANMYCVHSASLVANNVLTNIENSQKENKVDFVEATRRSTEQSLCENKARHCLFASMYCTVRCTILYSNSALRTIL